tara:strand:- start:1697 stop:2032 length:336 start_codon:yes stop_codon:yes gene_type:complete
MFFEIILLLFLIFINDLVYGRYTYFKIKKFFSQIIKLKNLTERNELNKILKLLDNILIIGLQLIIGLFFLSLTYILGCFLMFKYFPNLNFIIKTFLPLLLYVKFFIVRDYE